MNKTLAKLFPLILCVALIGCTSNPLATKAFVKSAVQTGVIVGVNQAPDAVPYLRLAAPVVCEAAKGTNQSPDWVIAQLEANRQAEDLKNANAVLIFNAAFGIYVGLWEEYAADDVQERATLQAWLEGVCEGLLAGLPPIQETRSMTASKRRLPPHLSVTKRP